jgi:hypothetical protein
MNSIRAQKLLTQVTHIKQIKKLVNFVRNLCGWGVVKQMHLSKWYLIQRAEESVNVMGMISQFWYRILFMYM